MDSTKVFSSFSADILKQICKHETLDFPDDAKKGEVVSKLEEYSDHIGFVIFTEGLSRDELESSCNHIKIDLSNEGKHPTKAILKKRLLTKMEELGPQKFFDKFSDSEELATAFCDTVGLDDTKDPKKSVKEVAKELSRVGLESLLNRLDLQFLKTIAEHLDLSTNTLNKARVVKSIISGKNVKPTANPDIKKRLEKEREDAEKSAKKSVEKRPSIKKGITYQDMYQLYLLSELEEFAKENGVKVSGKKSDLIKRILAWLDGDKENTMSQPKVKKTEKKTEKKSEKKETTPKSPKSSPKKAKETKESKEEKAASDHEGEKKSSKKGSK